MVRRWSYINQINILNRAKGDVHKQGSYNVNLRAAIYFHGSFTTATCLTRRRWSRRKHLHNWLVLANIVKTWAQFYRFQKNHLKCILRQHFTKYTFVSFNSVTVINSIPALHKGAETVALSPLPKKIIRIFLKFLNPRYLFLLSLKNINLAVVSFPSSFLKDPDFYIDNRYAPSMLCDGLTSFTGPSPLNNFITLSSTSFNLLLNFHFLSVSKIIKSLRKLLVLLTLYYTIFR